MKPSIQQHKFTEARNNFTAIIDLVQANRPQSIRKRKASEDDVFIIRNSLLKEIVFSKGRSKFRMHIEKEKDGSCTLFLDPFALAVNAKTKDLAAQEMIEDVNYYADDYMLNLDLYLKAVNRKDHLPLVIQVLLCTDEELRSLLSLA